MILVKDGKREPGHMDMQKLDEFCHMLPEVSRRDLMLLHPIDLFCGRQRDGMEFK